MAVHWFEFSSKPIQTDLELREADHAAWLAAPPAEQRRIYLQARHPRCYDCGQFLKKKPLRPRQFLNLGLADSDRPWVSHYYQDYFGEWDHI